MFQALLSNASRRVCSHAQHIHGSDRSLSSIIRGTNCKLSKSTQSIFSSNSTRTNYHTSIYSLKSSKKKKLRQSEPDDAVLELGRYERNEQGDWVRRVVKNKPRTAVLSPELEADIARVLEQDIDELAAPSRDQPRHAKSTDKKKTSTSAKAAVTRATEQSSATTKKKKKSKSKAVQSEGALAVDKELVGQYKELIDESDFKQTKTREIRAPSESNEETEHAVAQVVAWLKKEKLSDLCAIDLRLKTDWARFMVIATAMSERQNRAAAESIAHRLGQLRGKSYEVHTGGEDNWLIIFTGDMVIELFTEERRKFYDIERLWVLKRSLQEEMDIDPDDLVRFQYDEEDGMYDDEVRAKIAAERLARGEVVEEPEPVREVPEETPVIPYSSRDAKLDKKSKKRRRP